MRWIDWYDSLRVGDEILPTATDNMFSLATAHTVVSKKTHFIRLLHDGRETERKRNEFLSAAALLEYRRLCRNCKRLKDQHGPRGKCLFGPRRWD